MYIKKDKTKSTLIEEQHQRVQYHTKMKSNNFPNQLPFLPGNTYADPTITRYHKTQLLGIKDGIITGKHFSSYCYFITYMSFQRKQLCSMKLLTQNSWLPWEKACQALSMVSQEDKFKRMMLFQNTLQSGSNMTDR